MKEHGKEAGSHTDCKAPSSKAKVPIKIDRILTTSRKNALFFVQNRSCLEVALTFNCYSRLFITNYC